MCGAQNGVISGIVTIVVSVNRVCGAAGGGQQGVLASVANAVEGRWKCGGTW